MNIVIENFGPIRKATFDLEKRLSVFCGPSNTGKTYLSYVLYAYTRRRIYLSDERLNDDQVSKLLTERSLEIPLETGRIYELTLQRLQNIKKDLGTIFGLSDENAKRLFPRFRIKLDRTQEEYGEELTPAEAIVNKDWEGISGAPVLNQKGRLLGILCGGNPKENAIFVMKMKAVLSLIDSTLSIEELEAKKTRNHELLQ